MDEIKLPEIALIDSENTKICRVCKEKKSLKDFHPNKTCSKGVVGTCRLCAQEYKRKWYASNQERRSKKHRESFRLKKLQAIEYMGGMCADCKKQYPPYVYQFHHLNPDEKDFNPSSAGSFKSMKPELDKCIMLCANCHMVRHYGGDDGQ